MKISTTTQISRFLTSSSKPNIEYFRKIVLRTFSTNLDNTLAVQRALDIFYKTDLKDITLDTWETFSLSDYTNTTAMTDIIKILGSSNTKLIEALGEIKIFIPKETINLLNEFIGSQDLVIRVSLIILIILLDRMQDLL